MSRAFADNGPSVAGEFRADQVGSLLRPAELRRAWERFFAGELDQAGLTEIADRAIVDEGEAGVRRAYRGDKLARLTALKDRYDPDNVFHRNQNIRPSSAGSR